MALALVFTLLITMTGFEARCDSIRSNVLRLHVLANSDSDYDQAVKLAVRDRILSECGELFESVDGYDDALKQAESNLPQLVSSRNDEGKSFNSEREILYTVLFDMKKDMDELKKTVQSLMQQQKSTTTPGSTPVYNTETALIAMPEKNALENTDDFVEVQEYQDEPSLSVEEMEKKLIKENKIDIT